MASPLDDRPNHLAEFDLAQAWLISRYYSCRSEGLSASFVCCRASFRLTSLDRAAQSFQNAKAPPFGVW